MFVEIYDLKRILRILLQTMNVSFAGCGFLGIYHVGVVACFQKYGTQLLLEKMSGASMGAMAAASLILGLPVGKLKLTVAC